MTFLKNIPSTASDAELVQAYKQSQDQEVLGHLYLRYMDLCYGVCLKYLKDPATAQDATMNIYEELVEKVIKYDIDNFKPWLYRLASNHCLMQLRKEKRQPRVVQLPVMQLKEETHLEDVIQREEDLDKLEDCISELPEDQKLAVNLFYMQKTCYKDIADKTGEDVNKIRSYIQNGRRNLKICMENKIGQKEENE